MDAAERIERVREFNRFFTGVIGVLGESLLDTPYSLTEARVIFELGRRGTAEVAHLRESLGLDAGYLSRILSRFESEGLVTRERSPDDARRRVSRLTPKGRGAYRTLDTRAVRQVAALLEPLSPPASDGLLRAMDDIRRILRPRTQKVTLREAGSGDFGWIVARHGALYWEEYGWDEGFEALVARIVAEFIEGRDRARERTWIADVDGEPAGCVMVVRRDEETAQLRLLLVEPWARGAGVGTALVNRCLEFAREAGYRRMVLWTNDVLVEARRIYERTGFELVEEGPHHSFGADLVEQTWSLDL